MQFSSARFVTVTGTEVNANPQNSADARLALKELKQKKKEFGLHRRALQAEVKRTKDIAERAAGTATQNKKRGLFAAVGRLIRKAKAREPRRTLAELEAELAKTDLILLSLESCTVQIEGKLLELG